MLGLTVAVLLAAAGARGLRAVAEAFADRAYTPHGTLVPRSEPGAVLLDPADIAARAVRMVVEGSVLATDGRAVSLSAESVCVHGDTAGAVQIARAVRAALTTAGVSLASFVED